MILCFALRTFNEQNYAGEFVSDQIMIGLPSNVTQNPINDKHSH